MNSYCQDPAFPQRSRAGPMPHYCAQRTSPTHTSCAGGMIGGGVSGGDWGSSERVNGVLEKAKGQLEKGESVKFVHSYPWFWILRKNTSKSKVRSMPRVLTKKDEAEIIKTQEELKANKPPRVRQEAWDQFIYAMAEYEEGAIKAEAEQVHGLPLKEELKEKKRPPRRHFGGGDAEYESYGEPMCLEYGTFW